MSGNRQNFSGTEFSNKAEGFAKPVQLPRDAEERRKWQAANKAWWEATPMRYDWREEIGDTPGTSDYFAEVDQRFLSSAAKYLPWRNVPFDALIPFDNLVDKDVLEIGIGQGTHAQLLAPRCRSFTGIDLTEAAVDMTAKRFELFELPGTVRQMDAESLAFPDASFDFIWSWGVIHHSADTNRVLAEITRVLRPGGLAVIMVYHRSWWSYYAFGYLRRLFLSQFKGHSLHAIAQAGTDGAIARYYSPREWRSAVDDLLAVDSIRICGLKTDLLPLPPGRLKSVLEAVLPNGLTRFMTNRLDMGSFLVARMRKL